MPLFAPSINEFIPSGNTSGSTISQIGGPLVLAGGSNITLNGSTDGASQTISIVGGAGGGGGGGIAASAGTQLQTSGTLSFANSNGISFGLSNSSILTASYTVPTVPAGLQAGVSTLGSTNGSTGLVSSQVVFAGHNGLSASQSTNGQSATIGFGIPSTDFVAPIQFANSTVQSLRNASMFVTPFNISAPIAMTNMMMFGSFSHATSTSGTTQGSFTIAAGIYSLNGSTLSLIQSGSNQYTFSNTSNAGTSLYIGGLRGFDIPFSANLDPGQYWLAHVVRTSSAGSISMMVNTGNNALYMGKFGESSNSNRSMYPFWGIYTASTTGIPATIGTNEINLNSSAAKFTPLFVLQRNDI